MVSAVEVLARHQVNRWAQHDGWWGCTCDGDVRCDAQHQLDALKAAGYAVVKLDQAAIKAAHISYGPGANCEFDCCPPWIRDDDTEVEYSVSEAREYAAALLAAADAAEAQS